MKYCCYDFEAYAKVASTTTPNIKIVKFKPLVKGEENQNFGFYCLSGYETFSIFLPKLNLRFCPAACSIYLQAPTFWSKFSAP